MRGRVLTTRYRRSAARGGRFTGTNTLDGTLPAELGKLTDLESLCVALRRRRAAHRRDRSAPRSRDCGGVQSMPAEHAQRHDRQLDRLAGEAHLPVSAPLRHWMSARALPGLRGYTDGASRYSCKKRDAAGSALRVAPGTAVGEDAREDCRRRLGGRQGYLSALGGHAACGACSPIYLYVPLLGGSMMRTTGCCGTMWSSLGYQ
jgi:hypothetical protein